jgi:hypothetical protein
MANTIDFNVSTNAVNILNQTANAADNTAKGFTSAKAELRALNNQLLTMDQTSDAFKKASARAAELKDNISDLGAEISANAGNAFEGLSNNVGLFGSRLMDLDLAGAGQALKNMGTNVSKIDFKTLQKEIGGLIGGFASLGKAILANPILLLVGAIVAIIANFEDLIKIFPSVEKGLSGINEQERESLALSKAKADASQKAYENIDKQANILKLQGKSEREILNIKIKALETAIADRKAQLAITEKQAIVQVQTAKRNREILEGIIRFLSAPLELLLTAVDAIANKVGIDSKLAEGFIDLAAGLLIDPEELETELNKTIQENKDAIATMENDYAGLKLSVKKIDEDAAKEKKDNLKKENDDLAKANEDAKKLYKERRDAQIELEDEKYKALQALQETAQEKEVTAAVEASEALYALASDDAAAQVLIAQNLANKLAEINKKYKDAAAEEAEKKKAEDDKAKAELDKAAEDDLAKAKQLASDKLAAEQALTDAKFNLASTSVNLLGTLFAKNKKAADIAFALDKALAIAQVVVNTQREISAYNSNPVWSLSPDGGAAIKIPAIIGAKLRAAASIATIAGTAIGRFAGGGGGGTGAGSNGGGGTTAPSPANYDFISQQPNQQPPLQAYVVSSQVSSNLEAQQLIQNQSKLGG